MIEFRITVIFVYIYLIFFNLCMATGIQRTTGPVGKKFGMIPWVECETIIT